MTIEQNGFIITIADESDTAQSIMQGYDYFVDKEGKIIIGALSGKTDTKWQIIKAIENAKDLDELKVVLVKMLQIII